MGQYVVKKGDSPYAIAQKVLGDGNRWRELWKGDPRKLPIGITLNYGSQAPTPSPVPVSTPTPAPVAAPAAPAENPYAKMISDWYAMKPVTPGAFQFSKEEEEAARKGVTQEFKPYFQEQVDQSTENFNRVLDNARQGFSRRGLWGASSGAMETKKFDDNAKLMPTGGRTASIMPIGQPSALPVATGGPVSGMRQVGEQGIKTEADRSNTAFERSFGQSVAGGTQGRREEARDTWQRTIRDPYNDAFASWQGQLSKLQAQR